MKKAFHLIKNIGITGVVLAGAFAISLQMQNVLDISEHVSTTVAFAVFLISMVTPGYVYGVVAAFAGTLMINYAFTFPYFRLNFTIPTNLFSAITMIIISVLTSTLTTKVKHHEAVKAESEKERMRANLLRAVSHDLRTPLTTIYGSSSALLENRDALSEEQELKMLRSIREDAQWLIRMVENLLSITRIDTGKVELSKTPTVLDELVDSVLLKFKKHYPEQELELEIPDEILLIPMDPILMEQVISNILENAVQHAEGMTSLTLRVFTLGPSAIFEIADNGCGIDADRLNTIFELHETDSGYGYGLYIARAYAHQLGGNLSVDSIPGRGSTFTLRIPVRSVQAARREAELAAVQ